MAPNLYSPSSDSHNVECSFTPFPMIPGVLDLSKSSVFLQSQNRDMKSVVNLYKPYIYQHSESGDSSTTQTCNDIEHKDRDGNEEVEGENQEKKNQPRAIKRKNPDEPEDPEYRRKRDKNNESARRSRLTKRIKDEATAERVAILELENVELRMRVENLLRENLNMRVCMSSFGYLALNAKDA